MKSSNDIENTTILDPISLIYAASEGDLEEVKILIEKGININGQDDEGSTALIAAALAGHTEIINFLISKGADINIADNYGHTALTMVVEEGNYEMANLLINLGADTIKGPEGTTVLMDTNAENKDLAECIINNTNINYQTSDEGLSALMSAVKKGEEAKVKLLIEHKADLELKDKNGMTALMYALLNKNSSGEINNSLEIVKCLIEAGALINVEKLENIRKDHPEIYNIDVMYFIEKVVTYRNKVPSLLNNMVQRFANGIAGNDNYLDYAEGYRRFCDRMPEELKERIQDAIPDRHSKSLVCNPSRRKLSKWIEIINEEKLQNQQSLILPN